MENKTKIALTIAAVGLGVNQYEKSKLKTKPYLETDESQLKMAGGALAILGGASAGIFELTKNNPKARKISFIGLGGLVVLFVGTVVYAMKKFT